MTNALYFGDNLEVLRESIKDESVDLIYLDPPFNSNATYNVLFRTPKGHQSDAQIEAFDDTWHWGAQAEAAFAELMQQSNTDVAEVIRALRSVLGENDMMAYVTTMAIRLLELHRVLKPTGSLYLHCDPTAAHYLKIVLDQVFGVERFQSEIIWKRTSAHSSANRFGPIHDTIFFYAKGNEWTWNPIFAAYNERYLGEFYTHYDDDKRRWRRSDLTGAGTRNGETGQVWRGIDITAKGRHWAYPPSVLDVMDADGKVHWPKKEGGMPILKRYLDEQAGVPLQDVWTDINLCSANT
jgi:site-specific DNA-methyltransferase (adenine-specific)